MVSVTEYHRNFQLYLIEWNWETQQNICFAIYFIRFGKKVAGFKGKNSKNARVIILSYMICLILLLFFRSHHNTSLIHRIIHWIPAKKIYNKIKTKLRSDLPWNYHKVVYVDDWLPCIFFISLYTELRKVEANTLALLWYGFALLCCLSNTN